MNALFQIRMIFLWLSIDQPSISFLNALLNQLCNFMFGTRYWQLVVVGRSWNWTMN